MARIEWVHQRLLNWARWKAGACDTGLGYGRGNWTGVREDRYRESVIPTIAIDAEHMDRAVCTLDPDLRRTVEVMYLQDAFIKAAALQLFVAEATVKERIDRAHRKLAEALTEIQAKADAKRSADEAVQRSAKAQRGSLKH